MLVLCGTLTAADAESAYVSDVPHADCLSVDCTDAHGNGAPVLFKLTIPRRLDLRDADVLDLNGGRERL
jgi:hypothetical protein